MTAATQGEVAQGKTVHDIITLERTYKAAPARVFAAWGDAKARERWGRPNDEEIIVYDQAEFRVGGEDVSRCGPKDDLHWTARVRYLEIIRDARIVMAEHVSNAGVAKASALITVELEPVGPNSSGNATKLTLNIQIAAVDPGMIGGYNHGWPAALDNLAKEF
jgi:uncharacterized protein YndB with AHSA1/START domain